MQRIARAVRASGFLLASAVCAGAVSAAAADIYLKIEGHKGELAAGNPGGEIEIQSFHWGPRQTTSADGARSRTGNQVIMDDRAGREKMQPGGGGAQAAQPAEKRQHGAVTITKEWGPSSPQLREPLAKGSVWVKVASPWTACRAGARYPEIELGDGKASYRLSDVVVTQCAAGGASLDYAKVKVRGWDPGKKEE